jgi:[ribosomal protein S18]-alanine N-acetyltransferase
LVIERRCAESCTMRSRSMRITCAGRTLKFNGKGSRGAESQLTIRPLEPRDVEAVFEIQSACAETAQWALWDYERVTRGEMPGWIAEEECKVAGFLVARRVASEIEILNLGVRAELRRKGIGSALLREVMRWGKSLGAEKAFLEVRASNANALHFYERFTYQVTGRRPRYYSGPLDDALLLTANLV